MSDPDETQGGSATGIVAELDAEGFDGAEPVGRGGFGVVYRSRLRPGTVLGARRTGRLRGMCPEWRGGYFGGDAVRRAEFP